MNRMKKLWAVLLLLVASGQVFADEGMWVLKELNKQNLERMKELGFTPSYEQLYSETDPCVANAVVIFGGGCSGITVSNEGLIFTNHHCGFGSIQQLSSVEHDYLKDGFVSQSKEEELPVPGLTVRYLRETVDVSDRINSQIASIKEEHLRLAAADSIGQAMADSVGNTEFQAADVVPFYNNNKYFLIVYDVFNDVRMVFAPPSSVGNSAAIRTTGCGRAIRATSPCSAYMPEPTTSRLPTARIISHTSLNTWLKCHCKVIRTRIMR